MKLKSLRNILLVAGLVVAGVAHAQSAAVDPVQYIVAPEAPGPNAPVQIVVQGVGSFLGDADITWSVDGKSVQSGVGLTQYSFTTGPIGSETIVRVSIDSQTQGFITKTFVFDPSTVNLVWEADTSVPPLFRGHTRYSAGSALRLVAFPTVIIAGKKVSPQSLSYQWTINDQPQPSASGTGKYTLSYTGDQLQDSERVGVDVYFGTRKVAHGDVTIPATAPEIALYAKDPLRGVVWDSAVPQNIALNGKELTLQAQPYFFSNASLSGNLTWSWLLNDQPITGPDTNHGLLTLRQTGTGQGSATLKVSLQNQDSTQLLQSASTMINLVFGSAQSGFASFFGL